MGCQNGEDLEVMQATAAIDEGRQEVILGARIEHAQGVPDQQKETTGLLEWVRWSNISQMQCELWLERACLLLTRAQALFFNR